MDAEDGEGEKNVQQNEKCMKTIHLTCDNTVDKHLTCTVSTIVNCGNNYTISTFRFDVSCLRIIVIFTMDSIFDSILLFIDVIGTTIIIKKEPRILFESIGFQSTTKENIGSLLQFRAIHHGRQTRQNLTNI